MTYYNSVVLADSPSVYFKLDETSGSTATDSGSLGGTGTIAAGVTLNQTGINGGGKSISTAGGTTSYVSKSVTGTIFSDKVFSVEWWQKGGANSKDVGEYFGSGAGYGVLIDGSGKLKFTIYGGTTSAALTSTTTVTGSTWHHIVFTANGNSFKLYIDGTQEASSTTNIGTFSPSATLYVGSYQATSAAASYDEFALYDSELSSTRISAHRSAGITTPVDGGFTAAAMTASATAPTATFSNVTNAGFTAAAMTASATAPDAVYKGAVRRFVISEDASVNPSSTGTNYGTDTTLAADRQWYIKVPSLTLDTGETLVSAILYLTPTTTVFKSFNYAYPTSSWSEGTITWANKPSFTYSGTTSTQTLNADTPFGIDVTSLLASMTNGLVIVADSAGGPAVYSSEHATEAFRPYVEYTVAVTANASFAAGPLTASALMVDPSVATQTGTSVSAAVSTAAATMVAPSVTAERFIDVGVSVEPFAAAAEMPGGAFASPASVSVDAMSASADIVSPSVTTTQGVIATVPAMLASATIKQPAAVNGQAIITQEADDKYFKRVMSLSPKDWFRLNDSAYTADDRVGPWDGTLHGGVFVGQHNAPDNRHSFHFDGTGSIEQSEPGGTNVDENTQYDSTGIPKTTLDFSFRTTKPTQFLMAGKDNFQNPVTLTTSVVPPREIALKNGKITYRTYAAGQPNIGVQPSIGEFSGFKNLADGEWHSVSIRSGVFRNLENGVEIWVDGKLEVRRVVTNAPAAFVGFPDYIGGRPDAIDGFAMTPLSTTQWFEGDLSEVVWYDHLNSDDATTRLYYDFMAWSPIEAQPMEAFGFMTDDNHGRGNQKRALVLKWYEAEDGYSFAGDGWNNKMNFDALAGQGSDFAGYKLFWRSVDDINGQAYRDPVTDAQTLIDLELDVDINDYDVIMFRDWPDESNEFDDIKYYYGGAYERLLGQLRWANNQGVGLYITHPRLAADLGIVDRVEFVPTMEEHAYTNRQGNALGLYDYGSAAKFPWNIAGGAGLEGWGGVGSQYNGQPMNTDPAFLADKAYYYGDTNKNDRFRVRALIEGLTDIPSYMIQDAVYQKDFSLWGWQSVAFKYLHRMSDGLHIGDEYIFHGTSFGYDRDAVADDFTDMRLGRWFGYYASPISAVKAGTVVTTFGAKMWQGKQEVDNPYKDYATTIVLKPGDVLAGIPVEGRIYVNFTEQPSRQPDAVAVQVLPENNADFPAHYNPDTAAQREWEWSDTRKSLSTTNSPTSTSVSLTLPSGQIIDITGTTQNGMTLNMTRSSNLFPIVFYPSWQMNTRGLYWLSQASEQAEGDKTLSTSAATATASMPSPSVTAQHSVTVPVQPSLAVANMAKVAEDESGDAGVNVLPMTAEATMTGYSRTVSVGPATATAEMVENFDLVHASGEQVVLTLHTQDVTLFLKEEV